MTTQPADSRYLQAALGYAAKGWFVFPLTPRDKIPLSGTEGFKQATTNPEFVRRAWASCPDANIGLWPGPSGLIVADLDGPECEVLAQQMGLLREPTLVCISGREDGGRHLYFKAPGFPVSNVQFGAGFRVQKQDPYILFRSHGGYVVLPPSVHPLGPRYRWEGRLTELAELPSEVVVRLREAAGVEPESPSSAITGESVGEGGRNNDLTRVAGNLLVNHPIAAATELLWAYNVANCRPTLGRHEVEGIIASLSKREMKKPSRLTETGRVLTVAPEEPAPITPRELAAEQVRAAVERGRLDLTDAPQWGFSDLDKLVGRMVPGDFVVVGSLMGNGKTSFLMSQMDWFAAHRVGTLYIPLEIDPSDLRRRWAAWKLGFDQAAVARNQWHLLPEGAQDAHEGMLEEQGRNPFVQFPPDRRVTLAGLAKWMAWAAEHMHAPVVMLDHFHRMDFGGAAQQFRIQVTETVRAMKDLAREHKITLIAAAQLNQQGDEQLDRYFPPHMKRLKESAGIGEEADLVLMLSRRMRSVLSADDLRAVKAGLKSERDFEEPNTMTVTCRKARLEDGPRDRSVLLHVEAGRVGNRAESWRDHDYHEPRGNRNG